MSDDKKPRFLQQTTSQLLHQQEALRKRREMLERESTKPPAMRFGTRPPPRPAPRSGRSPPPPCSATASDRQGATTPSLPPAPSSSSVHRELNWSRSEDDRAAAERAPMRFSMAFRPSPAPAVVPRPRGAAGPHTPSSPTPREVNTSDQVDALLSRLRKEPSSPRAVSPRSPPPQRARLERRIGTPSENNPSAVVDVPVQILVPSRPRSMPPPVADSTPLDVPCVASEHTTPGRAAVELPARASPNSTQQRESNAEAVAEQEEEEGSGVAGFSNIFPVPRFTPVPPAVGAAARPAHRVEQTVAEEEEEEGRRHHSSSTPARHATGEFRTPRPVLRLSPVPMPADSATEAPRSAPAPRTESVTAAPQDSEEDEEVAEVHRATLSPAPLAANTEAAGVTEAPSGKAVSSPSRTPSASHRTRASPAPTAQDLIQSVLASAEKRPCGCERPTPSPEQWRRRHPSASPSPCVGSPSPAPVAESDRPMTEFGPVTHKCCDRPTPVSLSSQPAGGEVRRATNATVLASPWPTTENIINSILVGATEAERRDGHGARTGDLDSEAGKEEVEGSEEAPTGGSERFSNEEEAHTSRTRSPEPAGTAEVDEEKGDADGWDARGRCSSPARVSADLAAHTPSPVPSERQYGQSVLASAEKRCCGRPTPSERHVTSAVGAAAGRCDSRDARAASASPQPSAHDLLQSLDVSIEKSSQRGKPAPRATEVDEIAEEDVAGSDGRDVHRPLSRSMRTPSPTPTPEHVLASLQASAEKRLRSGAVDAASASTAEPHSSHPSHQSPTLTPQNVKDSVQMLMREQQLGSRSDAPTPSRPWTESSRRGAADSASADAGGNASASPMLTSADVDGTLEVLQRDRRRESRSTRAPRPAGTSPTECDGTAAEVSDIAMPSAETAALPSVSSPVPSDLAVASAMFFDCVSAPPTPALPDVGSAAAAAASSPVSALRVPPQFLDLQREVAAISQGRSRTRTPPPLRASEQLSPLPVPRTPVEVEATPRVEASTEQADFDAAQQLRRQRSAVAEEDEEALARRSSVVLVHPASSHQALIQHPHTPMPAPPAPTISPVQVPRSVTPPPPQQQLHRHAAAAHEAFASAERGRLASEDGGALRESPMPRPVSLRSQVALATVAPHRGGRASRSPAAAVRSARNEDPLSGGADAVAAPAAPASRAADDAEEQVDLFDAANDWMDLVEPLRPQTITISPQGGTVVHTTHSHSHDAEEPAHHQTTPTASRKRSRSAQTPQAPPTTPVPAETTRAAVAATPASIALTMDDGASSGEKSSRVAATPNSHVSQTPRSSTRGRKSQAEELLEMLPADVVAEVTRMTEAEEEASAAAATQSDDARLSLGSPAGRLSGASDGDSTFGFASSISQRVTQRPPRTYHSYDYYIQYLEGIASSSATKARKAAGRRMQRTVTKDVAHQDATGTAKAPKPSLSPLQQSGITGRSHSRSSSSSSRSSSSSSRSSSSSSSSKFPSSRGRPSTVPTQSPHIAVSLSAPDSPQTPTPPRALRGGRQLTVSTRLSAELEKALFQQASPAKAKPAVSPRNATKASKKEAAAPAKRTSAKASATAASVATATHKKKAKAKKVVKKFMTAKSMRLPRRGAKHGKK